MGDFDLSKTDEEVKFQMDSNSKTPNVLIFRLNIKYG